MERAIRNLKDVSVYRTLLERLDIAAYIQNSHGEIVDANPGFLRLFGAASIETLQFASHELLIRLQPLSKRLDLQNKEKVVRRVSFPDPRTGEPINYLEICFCGEDIERGEIYYTGLLIPTGNEKIYVEVEKQNLRDPLTGTYNRHYLRVFEKENSDRNWGCILFTMDRLRRYSESFGERAGLEAICKMGRYILRFVRVQDAVVRLDDENYVLLISSDEATLQRMTRRMKTVALNQAPLSFSMGVAYRTNGESMEQTIFRAGRNLTPVKVLERLPRRNAS
jgi:diguanylate cyclase (GGDEF)-like protein